MAKRSGMSSAKPDGGQKTKAGFYDYDAARAKSRRRLSRKNYLKRLRTKKNVAPCTIGEDEIRERLLLPMINEGSKILMEGKASRASGYRYRPGLYGHGRPAYRGGPMFMRTASASKR